MPSRWSLARPVRRGRAAEGVCRTLVGFALLAPGRDGVLLALVALGKDAVGLELALLLLPVGLGALGGLARLIGLGACAFDSGVQLGEEAVVPQPDENRPTIATKQRQILQILVIPISCQWHGHPQRLSGY